MATQIIDRPSYMVAKSRDVHETYKAETKTKTLGIMPETSLSLRRDRDVAALETLARQLLPLLRYGETIKHHRSMSQIVAYFRRPCLSVLVISPVTLRKLK